jgi:hypothetical protein
LSEASIIAEVKALLGEFSNLLYFAEEGHMVLAKPKKLLSEESCQALRQRVEEIGKRYVDLNTGFKIRKATAAGIPGATTRRRG